MGKANLLFDMQSEFTYISAVVQESNARISPTSIDLKKKKTQKKQQWLIVCIQCGQGGKCRLIGLYAHPLPVDHLKT